MLRRAALCSAVRRMLYVEHCMIRQTISLNLNEDELELKKMIQGLKSSQTAGNPYYTHSESKIAKLLLMKVLPKEFAKYGSGRK